MKRIIAALLTVTAAGAVFAAGGCSSDEAAEAESPPVCDSAASVRLTVEHIGDVDVSENGIVQLKPYLQQLHTELQTFVADARAQFGAQADQLQTAMDQLSTSVDTARANPDATTLSAVRTSITGVQSSTQGLSDAMAGTC